MGLKSKLSGAVFWEISMVSPFVAAAVAEVVISAYAVER